MRIIVKEVNEVLLDTADDNVYTFDLDQMRFYDWYVESVNCVLNELDLEGPATARFIYLLSMKFLSLNDESFVLTLQDLK